MSASESARASSAAEAAFRVPYPNARRRRLALVALDAAAASAAARLAAQGFPEALTIGGEANDQAWIERVLAPAREMPALLADADHLFLLASAGADPAMAAAVADAAAARGIPVSALLIAPDATADAALTRALARLRPVARMLVLVREEADIAAILSALRA